MNAGERKKKLRRKFLRIRKNIPDEEYRKKSDLITKRLKDSQFYNSAGYIHCYISLNERKEVDTHGLLEELLPREKKVVVPVTDFESGTLTNRVLHSFEDLEPNRWGVPEPPDGEEVEPQELDLVIVPMVAGDNQCNRLGYGKGFYDRFLSDVDCPKIGLLFECCLTDNLPVEDFDVKLDQIMTENRVVNRD